jgi:hypothetical protein
MPLALGAFSAPEALAGFEKTITWDPAKCKKPAGGCYRFLTLAPPTQSQIASYHAQCIDVVWTSSSGQTSFWPAGCAGAQGQDIGLLRRPRETPRAFGESRRILQDSSARVLEHLCNAS